MAKNIEFYLRIQMLPAKLASLYLGHPVHKSGKSASHVTVRMKLFYNVMWHKCVGHPTEGTSRTLAASGRF